MSQGKFTVSSYVDIWRVILLLLGSQSIFEAFDEKALIFPKFKNLKDAIDQYYNSAFRPEVDQSLELIENSEVSAGLMAKTASLSGKAGSQLKQDFSNVNVNLATLEKNFKYALSSLKLNKNFILFIDGIDIRPDNIDFNQYIECIRGLANAAWELNSEYFSNIKDSANYIKVVLLLRPDIMDALGFQNLNAKVRDNGVVLNWITKYSNFESSSLFHLVAGTLAKQQHELIANINAWKHYFPYDLTNMRLAGKVDDPFVGLLRYSFYRPRDIIQYLKLMQSHVSNEAAEKSTFSEISFKDSQREFSDYLLGEVKDYLSFYYSTVDFDEVVGFFSRFGGSSFFTWDKFESEFSNFKTDIDQKLLTIAELTATAEDFLQFLYSLNIIGYHEPDEFGGTFVHYCFRDRTTVKLRPKVRFGLKYQVHPGLQRALLVGNRRPSVRKPKR